MIRQAKRMMQRQKTTPTDRVERAQQNKRVTLERRERTPLREFVKQVRLELKKVQWPSRQELFSYTLVVLVAVVVLTALVFAMDLVFAKGVLRVFRAGG